MARASVKAAEEAEAVATSRAAKVWRMQRQRAVLEAEVAAVQAASPAVALAAAVEDAVAAPQACHAAVLGAVVEAA